MSECAGVLQYAQTCFEGLKAYTTEDGRIVTFRPDLNAERMVDSANRLEMPLFPKERFLDAVDKVVRQTETGSALRLRRHAVHPSVYVRNQPGHRREAG